MATAVADWKVTLRMAMLMMMLVVARKVAAMTQFRRVWIPTISSFSTMIVRTQSLRSLWALPKAVRSGAVVVTQVRCT